MIHMVVHVVAHMVVNKINESFHLLFSALSLHNAALYVLAMVKVSFAGGGNNHTHYCIDYCVTVTMPFRVR